MFFLVLIVLYGSCRKKMQEDADDVFEKACIDILLR